MPSFETILAGARLRYPDIGQGSGTPLVMLHGPGCASSFQYPAIANDPALSERQSGLGHDDALCPSAGRLSRSGVFGSGARSGLGHKAGSAQGDKIRYFCLPDAADDEFRGSDLRVLTVQMAERSMSGENPKGLAEAIARSLRLSS